VSRVLFKILAALTVFVAVASLTLTQTRLPDEPGASPGITLFDISHNAPGFSSAFPSLTVNPKSDQAIAVAWRVYFLPIDTNAPKGSRTAECHVSISTDGGATFRDANLMDVLRIAPTDSANSNSELWYCNAAWVTFGPEGTTYAGGSMFTANGVSGPAPKQGEPW
jgi:hypothetical protein